MIFVTISLKVVYIPIVEWLLINFRVMHHRVLITYNRAARVFQRGERRGESRELGGSFTRLVSISRQSLPHRNCCFCRWHPLKVVCRLWFFLLYSSLSSSHSVLFCRHSVLLLVFIVLVFFCLFFYFPPVVLSFSTSLLFLVFLFLFLFFGCFSPCAGLDR